jgi:hypothetical protein
MRAIAVGIAGNESLAMRLPVAIAELNLGIDLRPADHATDALAAVAHG